MQIRLLASLLLITIAALSCQNTTTNSEPNKQVNTVEIPDWQANKVLKQISETISSKPFQKNLILKIISTEESIEKGEFILELTWLNEKHLHDILLPVVPEKFYGEPYLAKHPEKAHTFEVGYMNPEGIKKEIYEVAIINNNLHFKQTQVFQLIKEP